MSGLNFHTVLEPNHHLVLTVDRHPIDKDVVGHRVEGRGQRLLLHERFQKVINGSQPGLLVGDGFFQLSAARFEAFVAVAKGVMPCPVGRLVKRDHGVLADASGNLLGGDAHLCFDQRQLGFQRIRAEHRAAYGVKAVPDLVALSDQLVQRGEEQLLQRFLVEMGCAAGLIAVVFPIASPNHPAILVIGMPHFGAVHAAAFPAVNGAGENPDATVPVGAGLPHRNLPLHHV